MTKARTRGVVTATLALGMALVPALPANSAQAQPRWPSWPTEVDKVAAPLVAGPEGPAKERDQAPALARLQQFPTELIEPYVLAALNYPSSHVRREALRICYRRRMLVCADDATELYTALNDPNLRVAALQVIALDPTGARLKLLLTATRAPDATIRAQAAALLGVALLHADARETVHWALVAKLSDTSATVRRYAVESIGLLGPGEGTLTVARLLEDTEPQVRAAAAEALGRMQDPRSAPALIRALEGHNNPTVVAKLIEALARIPGKDLAKPLLGYLDDPPPGQTAHQIAQAIGDRPNPQDALIKGLLSRLREPQLTKACLEALLLIGRPAQAALEQALARGLDPALDLEVRRLLAALEPPAATPPPQAPALDDATAWRNRLRIGPPQLTLAAGVAVGEHAPPWLTAVLHSVLEQANAIDPVRPWLAAMATHVQPLEFRNGAWLPWAKLIGWAHDKNLAAADRCFATLALGSAGGRGTTERIRKQLGALARDRDPRVRGCATTSAARLGAHSIVERSLVDTDPGVRVLAGVALRASGAVSTWAAARLRLLRDQDPSARVRRALADALDHSLENLAPAEQDAPLRLRLTVLPGKDAWVEARDWVAVELDAGSLESPALTSGTAQWTAVLVSGP